MFSINSRDRIFVKEYGFFSFAKNIRKKLSGKYNEKQLDHAKNYATDTVKATSKRVIKKRAEAAGDLTDNDKKLTNSETFSKTKATSIEKY